MNLESLTSQFLDKGYLHLENIVNTNICDNIIKSSKQFIAQANPNFEGKKQPRIVNLHIYEKQILELFKDENINNLITALFNKSFTIYTSLYFKYPTQQPIHSDAPVFHTYPKFNFIGFWVALEQANEVNGCLEVVPESHKLVHGSPKKFCLENNLTFEDAWPTYQNSLLQNALSAGLTIKKVPVEKGDIVLWHGNLLHGGSKPMDDTRERNSIVFHITPIETQVYKNYEYFNEVDQNKLDSTMNFSSFEGISYHKAPCQIGENV